MHKDKKILTEKVDLILIPYKIFELIIIYLLFAATCSVFPLEAELKESGG